jgi:WD40 repeat protein
VGQFQGCQALCSARVGKDVVALGCLGGLIVGVSLGVSVAATCTTSSSEVWRLQLPASADVLSLCASDSHLVAGSKDGTVTCMPLPASGAKAPQPLHKGAALHRGAVWDIAVDGSGKKFVTAGDDQVLLVVDAGDAGGKVLDKLVGHHAPVMCVAASPERIVSGDSDGVVHVWAWDTGLIKNSLKGHAARACGVARLPGGGTATCSQDGTLRVWSPAGVEERRAEGLGKPARMVGEPSTGLLAVVVGRHALVYAPTSAMCPVASFALPHPAAHLHFSARDQLVATGPFGMVAWSLAIVDLAHMCSMPSHDDDVTSVAMLGTVAVSGGKDSRVHVWDLEAVESERVLEADSEVWSVVLSRDGALTAAACEDGSVLLWSTRTGARLSTVPHTDVTLAVSLSSDSETLATGGWDSSVRLYTVPKSGAVGVSPRKTMGGHSGWVNALSFHPSEPRVLVSASADTTCRLWDAATATGLRALASHSAPVLCCRVGEAHLMASGSIDMAVHLHDLRSPDAKVDALLGHRGPVTALQFLRGDRYLLSVSGDKTARLWDLRQGRLVVGFPMPAKALSVAADPEGAVFMAGIIKSAHAPLHLFHLPEMYFK